ncbi:MAG: hypothetical protein Q8Q06_00745 [bacterium]|nr:hypothetical protein [bacterium]
MTSLIEPRQRNQKGNGKIAGGSIAGRIDRLNRSNLTQSAQFIKTHKDRPKIKVGIIGIGMVGEPIARWFSNDHKYIPNEDLFCYDIDPKKGYRDDVNNADIIFVAVPTPPNPDGSCNTSILENAISMVRDGKIIVIKSTVPPGTIEKIQKKYPDKKLVFSPEFLTESQAWLDFIRPDRQIVAHTAKSYTDIKEVLALLPRAHFERPWSSDYSKKTVNVTEAEMAKYASNVFGYIKVVYGNILADMAHALSIDFKNKKINASVDYDNIKDMLAADPRIGPAWLNVGYGNYSGAGGYCFPKDMAAFISFGENLANDIDRKNDGKLKHNASLVTSLRKGVEVLKAVHSYNEALLKWQGLTMEEVSKHGKEIATKKIKPIRI